MRNFSWTTMFPDRLRRLARDRKGVAAIEFAFIAPLLLSMYFVTMEIAPAIDTNKKVGRASSMVADLVTQHATISKSEVEAIMEIGQATLNPYNRSRMNVVLTAINITDETTPKVLVSWSRKMVNGAFSQDAAKGSVTTVPASLKVKGSFLIRVEASLNYRPMITWAAGAKETLGLLSAFDNIQMGETYYLRPRMSNSITCSDC